MAFLKQDRFLSQVVASDLCAGCGACAAIAPDQISFDMNGAGHPRPSVQKPLPAELANAVAMVCPGATQIGGAPAPEDDLLWGSYHAIRRGWAREPQLRHSGASGGALSAFLVSLLDQGIIEQVLQVAADPADAFGNRNVVTRNRDAILAAAGSRYAPSSPLSAVPALLRDGRKTAFVGRPCDVVGLRHWAKLDPGINEVFPVKISFFCAGTPGAVGAGALAEAFGTSPDAVRRMRYRGRGWPGRCQASLKDGEVTSMSYDRSWGSILSKHVQHRCRVCADGIGMAADIVFADAWRKGPDGGPSFAEAPGESLILARSALGRRLLQRASQHIETHPFDISDLAALQPGQHRRRTELLGRLAGRVAAGLPIPRYRGLGIWANARRIPLSRTVRAALGMLRRRALLRRART